MLKTPFKEVTSLALSRDGTWVAFTAREEKEREDVYWMNVAGGRPTRITEEAAPRIFGADFSSDASQVVYACGNELMGPSTVKLIPVHGGGGRTIADSGIGPRWRPDGQRVGYLRLGTSVMCPSASGNLELWSVKPDGTDKRCEVIDTLSGRPVPWAFCWSPDSRSVAWVRNYSSRLVVVKNVFE